MEKYCGSCSFPNTPSPTATTAPRTTAINTAAPPFDVLMRWVAAGSDIAIALDPDRPDLDAVDVRDAIGGQLRCGSGRTVLAPLHAGHSPGWVDDPAVADTRVLIDIQSGGWLR